MKKSYFIIFLILILSLNAQALFEVKDASNNSVLEVAQDGLRIFNEGDTLMVISVSEIKANLNNSKNRGLSRSFSVSTNTTSKAGVANALEITTDFTKIGTRSTTMSTGGSIYSNFTPDNIFLGLNAGIATIPVDSTSGVNNVFIGNSSGATNSSGKTNVFIGNESGYSNSTGNYNTFMGYQAGHSNSNGGDNIYIGYKAGHSVVGGFWNNFIGKNSGINKTTGNWNNFFGMEAGANNNGYYNIFIGHIAGQNNSGNNNVFLGSQSGTNNTGSSNVFLGHNSGQNSTGSNKLYIDNTNTNTPLLYGEFDNDLIRINGDFNVTGNSSVGGTFSAGNTAITGTISSTSNISTSGGMLNIKTLQIADMGSDNLGLDGDLIPYGGSALQYDMGNNIDGEYWDDVVADDFINYVVVKSLKDVKSIDSGLNMIMKLRPVTYKSDRQRFGLIPDELEKVFPEAVISQDVDFDPETGQMITRETEKGIVYDQMIPVLIKAIQEQQEEIEKLKRIIENQNQ
ncbi:MAG: tail fiber domain-containing protein [Candidatus Delongbacteria bacterium]|jgi:hypothetical protein|nr:tail fiber domain-containing protein [Candidatus Delongbacteria bacterium]